MVSRVLDAFQWGAGGAKLTPEQVARQREIAASLMQRGNPAFHNAGWLGALGRGLEGAYSGWQEGRADRAETENAELSRNTIASLLSGIGGGAPADVVGATPAVSSDAIAPVADPATDRVASAHSASATPGQFSGSQQEFVDMLLPAAMEASQRTGIDPRIIVAQAAQETGWGRSAPGNNFFGIKSHGQGGGQALKTHEYINGNRVNVTDSFRTFADPADSVRGYADFILNNPRYKPLMAAQGLDAQLEALQASGYATDPNYSRSVGSIARGISLPSQQPAEAALESIATGQAMPTPDSAPVSEQMGTGSPGEIRRGPDGRTYQYAETTGMAGATGTSGWIPVNAGAQVAQAGGINPAIIEAISSPYVNDQTRQIAQLLVGQQIQANDPYRQAQLEKLRLETDALRDPQQKLINAGGGNLYNPNTGEWISAPAAEGGLEGPDAYQTLVLRARAAGMPDGSPEFKQFMAEGGRTIRDPENERRINALTDRGMSRQEAENIVYGFTQVVSDPVLGSPMIVDRTNATATPIDQGIGAGQAPSGPAVPPPGGSLYDLADVATGAVPGLQETWTAIAPQLGLPGVDGVTESRQIMNAAGRDLIRALSINPRFPVGEMERIEKEINISPNKFTSPQALKERMQGVDTVLRRRLENERRTASNSQLPVESRRNALQAANDIENFLVTLGVPQDRGQRQQGAPQPGSIEDGYRFIGGDPADPNSWEPVQ